MENVKKKGVLLAISILLLIASGIYLAFAWYTKMTSVSGLEFDVARWDFSANYSYNDYQLNVYKYSQVNSGNGEKAAPGTAGEIPIVLSAKASETDVNYFILVDKSKMSREFQERIFFYEDEAMTTMITPETQLNGTIKCGEEDTVSIYWKWIYEFDDIPKSGSKTQDGYDLIENEDEEDFDEFDTAVGKKPDLYESQMNAVLRISGLQSEPTITD